MTTGFPAVATGPWRGARLVSLGGLSVLLLLGLMALIAYPIGDMIYRSFVLEVTPGQGGVIAALLDSDVLAVLGNTVLVVALSGALAMAIGAGFAWQNQRTDAGLGWAGDLLPLMPLLVPQIAGVAGWVMLLAPQAGLANGVLRDALAAFGVTLRSGPINLYTLGGLVAIMALYLVPYVYLIVAAALQSLDPNLEEASRMCRAGALQTLWRVTLPAIRPALIAAALTLVMIGFAIFSVPIAIGTGARIDLLTVRIYRLVFVYPPRTDLAILLGLVLTLVVQSALLAQIWIDRRQRAAMVGGKGMRAAVTRLGAWRRVAQAVMIVYLLCTAVLPVLALVIVSLQPFWSARINWAQLGLQNYVAVLIDNPISARAVFNSLLLGVVGGTLGMGIAAVLALAGRTGGARLRGAIDVITAIPAGIPHVVIAVGFVLCFSSGWLNVSGTLGMLLLAYLVINMPQAMRSASAAIDQVGWELVEASQVFKASPFRGFCRILLPLMLPSLAAGWIILFVQMSSELTASALLAGTTNPVVGQVILDFWQNGSLPQVAALAIVMTAINAAVVLAARAFGRRAH